VANITSIISTILLLGGLVAAAMLLRRYRDRLNTAFIKGPIVIKGVANLGDGSRLVVVEVNGQQALCGVGRQGVGAITLLPTSSHLGEAS
jgi:flagellar biogenesis protein FliO